MAGRRTSPTSEVAGISLKSAAIISLRVNVMERTVIDWVEELRGLDPLEAAKTILSGLGKTRHHDVKTLAYVLTAWAVLAKRGEKTGAMRCEPRRGESGDVGAFRLQTPPASQSAIDDLL
jgi:hypothetical protein